MSASVAHRGAHAQPYVFTHNPAAWVGIVLCVLILLVWLDRNTLDLTRRRQHDE